MRHVLHALSLHMNSAGGDCFPSVRTLVAETNLSRPTVMDQLRKAADSANGGAWILRVDRGRSGRGWKRHGYQATIPDVVKELYHDDALTRIKGFTTSPKHKVKLSTTRSRSFTTLDEGGQTALPPTRSSSLTTSPRGGQPHRLTWSTSPPDVVKEVDLRTSKRTPVEDVKKVGGKSEKLEPISDAPPLEKIFEEDDWQMEYSILFASRLGEAGVLAPAVERARAKKLAAVMQKWAATFDKLHRLDGHSQETIQNVMLWLFTPGNWWIKTANIRSAEKLRKKGRSGEMTFDVLLVQMRRDQAHTKSQIPELTTDYGDVFSD